MKEGLRAEASFVRDGVVRVLALVACALVIVFPVRGLFALPGLPWALKASWLALVALAWWWPRASLLAFLVGAPLLPIVPSLARWPTVSLPSAWVWALLVAAWLSRVRRPGAGRLPRAAACLLLISIASLLATLYPLRVARDSFGQLWAEMETYLVAQLVIATSQRPVLSPILAWVTLAEGMGLLWLVLRAIDPERDDVRQTYVAVATAIAAGAGLVATHGVRQWITHDNLLTYWLETDPYIVRVNASFTDVNSLGAFLASSLPVVAAVAVLRHDTRWRVCWAVVTGVVLLGMVFTASRVAWLATALASTALVTLVLAWRLGSWSDVSHARFTRATLAGALVALLTLGGLTAWSTARDVRHADQRSYFGTLLYTLNLHAPTGETLKGRTELWHAAIRMMSARPLTGIGIGRYFKELAAWVPDPAALARPQENAHNYFLQVGAELGLPGLACLAWLFLRSVGAGARAAHAPGPKPLRRVALATAIGVGAFALTLMTGHSLLLREGQLTFWALAGLALAAPGALGRATLATRQPRAARWVVPAVAVTLAATMHGRLQAEIDRVMEKDLTRETSGFYDEEEFSSGATFRWTAGRAVFNAPAHARVVSIEIRAIAPFPQAVRVYHEGLLIDQVVLNDQAWHTLRFVSPLATPRHRFRRFELRVEPTWHAPDDPRELGVMVGAISWRQ